ncbi:unnamed protein product [Caenorhabditis nigoni]
MFKSEARKNRTDAISPPEATPSITTPDEPKISVLSLATISFLNNLNDLQTKALLAMRKIKNFGGKKTLSVTPLGSQIVHELRTFRFLQIEYQHLVIDVIDRDMPHDIGSVGPVAMGRVPTTFEENKIRETETPITLKSLLNQLDVQSVPWITNRQ